MRIPKKAREEVQVDYAGLTVPVMDPKTGETQEMQVFVGVLGASGYIYCEAHRSQSLPIPPRSLRNTSCVGSGKEGSGLSAFRPTMDLSSQKGWEDLKKKKT